jgi:hypothetical protein
MLKKFRTSVLVALLLVFLPVLGYAQTAMNVTTLSAAVTSGSTDTVYVASVTGFGLGRYLYVDQEAMKVNAIAGLKITVTRGVLGTRGATHASGVLLAVGTYEGFTTVDQSAGASCTQALIPVLPLINTVNGNIWNCRSDGTNVVWVLQNSIYQTHLLNWPFPTGTYREIRGEITTYNTFTSGNLVGVRGAVTIAAGATVSGGYLYGVQGKAITGTGIITAGNLFGVFGQLDVSGATLTSPGHIAAISGNIYGYNSGTSTSLNLLYLEAAGGGILNSVYQSFGKATYVFDIQTNVHSSEANTSCTPSAVTGTTGGIHVIVDGVGRWIPLAATCT